MRFKSIKSSHKVQSRIFEIVLNLFPELLRPNTMGWFTFISINPLARFTTLLITRASQKVRGDTSRAAQKSKGRKL